MVIDKATQEVQVDLVRHSDEEFELVLVHPEYALTLVRREGITAVVLPKHRKVFWGVGAVDEEDHLGSRDLLKRTIKGTSEIASSLEFVKLINGPTLSQVFLSAGQMQLARRVNAGRDRTNRLAWIAPRGRSLGTFEPIDRSDQEESQGGQWRIALDRRAAGRDVVRDARGDR